MINHDDIEKMIAFIRNRIAYGMAIPDVVEGCQKRFPESSTSDIFLAYKAAKMLDADLGR